MFIAYAVVGSLLALALAASAALVFTRNGEIVATLSRLGVPAAWLPWLGTAKAAGGAGLLVGLAAPLIGVAAAAGVALFFAGALVTHLRSRDYAVAPVVLLAASAIAALVLRVLSA